jgi:ABC-2 type transport system ATP-binding protein
MMISLNKIGKTFNKGKVTALKDITFSVEQDEIMGLIGPDGSGKTTIFRILTTLLLADEGEATVNGFDVVKEYKKIRSCVGYMPGKFSLYQNLTIEENLNFFATVFGTTIKENYDLIKEIYQQIEPFKDRRAGKLSGGMKQKLGLCCALIHKPVVLFLDKPTTGVDVVSRREFWEMLKKLKNQGITVLVSTPYMNEANLCDRIALIQKGQILSIGTPAKIIQSYPKPLYAIKSSNIFKSLEDARTYPGIGSCFAFGDVLHATFNNSSEKGIIDYLLAKGHRDASLEVIKPGVEDCFIDLLKN